METGLTAGSSDSGVTSIEIDRSTISESIGNGIQAAGTATTVQMSNSAINHNANGANIVSPAAVATFSYNVIAQNVIGTLLIRTLN